jgi:hypothetical protein
MIVSMFFLGINKYIKLEMSNISRDKLINEISNYLEFNCSEKITFIYEGRIIKNELDNYDSDNIIRIVIANHQLKMKIKDKIEELQDIKLCEDDLIVDIEDKNDSPIDKTILTNFIINDKVQYLMYIIHNKPHILQIVNQYVSHKKELEFIDISAINVNVDEYNYELDEMKQFLDNLYSIYQIKFSDEEICKLLCHFNKNINKCAQYMMFHIMTQ